MPPLASQAGFCSKAPRRRGRPVSHRRACRPRNPRMQRRRGPDFRQTLKRGSRHTHFPECSCFQHPRLRRSSPSAHSCSSSNNAGRRAKAAHPATTSAATQAPCRPRLYPYAFITCPRRRLERISVQFGLPGCPHRPVLAAAAAAARFLPPPNSVLAAEVAAARGMEGGRRNAPKPALNIVMVLDLVSAPVGLFWSGCGRQVVRRTSLCPRVRLRAVRRRSRPHAGNASGNP